MFGGHSAPQWQFGRHHERSGINAVGNGRIGPPRRRAYQPSSILGELGGLIGHDPQVADTITQGLNGEATAPTLRAAARARHDLTGVQGFEPPSWEALADGVRPPFHDMDDGEPGVERHGWQHEAASRLEREFRERHLMPIWPLTRELWCGPRAGHLQEWLSLQLRPVTCSAFLLLRRLRLPLPLSACSCRCGRLLDSLGHHRASCSRAGVLGRRGFAVESAGARICREAGGRVTTNVMRDLDLRPAQTRDRADGLPLFGGVQLAVDTTLVSPLHCDGTPHRGADNVDGAILAVAQRRKG